MNHVRRQSFNPNMYTSSTNVQPNAVPENDEVIIKGDNINWAVNMKVIEQHLDHFRNHHHLKINELSGEDKEKFNTIVSSVQLLFNTPFYNKFYEKVKSRFENLEHVNPGTVGGYMSGCLIKSKFPGNPNCSPLCINGIPNPHNLETHGPCSERIVMAEYVTDHHGKSGYLFTTLRSESAHEKSTTIIYTNCKGIQDFKGFTANEKDILRNMKVSGVQLYFMESNTHSKVMDLNDVKSNQGHPHTHNDGKTVATRSGSGSGLFFILIMIILIIIFCGWKYMSKKL